ncbi:MAG TPA: SDR family oxidoreductase [Nitriliruptorales bacterium]|nr:SDR family oxidoreductase [Nitriliruptorales bacterium]
MPTFPWSVALVTGASSGIGREFARLLAADGTNLVVVARRTERLEELREELTAAHDVEVEVLSADLTKTQQRALVEDRLQDGDAPVDLLVNNAGFGTYGRFDELDADREERELQLLVVAVHRLTRAAVPGMLDRGHGSILNVSSLAGFQPLPYDATYSAAKAFVTRFSEALHEEYRGTGVGVTALCPGFVRTEFHERADIARGGVPRAAWLDAERVAREGLHAAARGAAVHVPGVGYRALAAAAGLAPRALVRRIAGVVTRRI